jgi:hypothetical protein
MYCTNMLRIVIISIAMVLAFVAAVNQRRARAPPTIWVAPTFQRAFHGFQPIQHTFITPTPVPNQTRLSAFLSSMPFAFAASALSSARFMCPAFILRTATRTSSSPKEGVADALGHDGTTAKFAHDMEDDSLLVFLKGSYLFRGTGRVNARVGRDCPADPPCNAAVRITPRTVCRDASGVTRTECPSIACKTNFLSSPSPALAKIVIPSTSRRNEEVRPR